MNVLSPNEILVDEDLYLKKDELEKSRMKDAGLEMLDPDKKLLEDLNDRKLIINHSGSKYLRVIHSAIDPSEKCEVDVYSVLVAFNVGCPALQHAIKKLLCAGIRNKGTKDQDLQEAIDAINRSIVICKNS